MPEFIPPNFHCSCGDQSTTLEGAEEARARAGSARSNLDFDPDAAYNIGLIFSCVGNVDDENELTETQILGQVKSLNRWMAQTDPYIAAKTPPSQQPNILPDGVKIHFYLKDITRNYVLPSGTWHSFGINVNTDYFGNRSKTMNLPDYGGASPDRENQYIQVVCANYSDTGNDPRFYDNGFQNLTSQGFTWMPIDIFDNPLIDPVNYPRYMRIILASWTVGGEEPAEKSNIHNWYLEEGISPPDDYFRGALLPHEMGHYLNIEHSWGHLDSGYWANPNYHSCGLGAFQTDLQPNDGPFLFNGTEGGVPRTDGWTGPPEELFIPMNNRNTCGDPPAGVPYTNTMNYGDERYAVMYTPTQMGRMRNTLQSQGRYPQRVGLRSIPAPIDFNNRTCSVDAFIANGNQTAQRVYRGNELVWQA